MDENLNNVKEPVTPEITGANGGKGKKKLTVAVVSVLIVVILALIAAIIVKEVVITTFIVDGISMYPTLDGGDGENPDSNRENGEKLILNKVAEVKRGDIVVFRPGWDIGADVLVKRVIALGGDTIEIKLSEVPSQIMYEVYVNGELLNEPYINGVWSNSSAMEFSYAVGAEFTVPDGYIFCMGDNRDHSSDCRIFGPVSEETVIGKCFLIKGMNGKFRKP